MIVYSPTGEELCDLKDFEVSSNLMGESVISASYYSSSKVDFKAGSYCTLDGNEYKIYYPKPSGIKTARTDEGIGDAMEYDILLYSDQKKLTEISFLDYVPGYDDTDVYYTGNSIVTFYGTVDELSGRLQANLDRYYKDIDQTNPWLVSLAPDFESKVLAGDVVLEEKSISASNNTCWEVLQMVNDQFDLDFVISGNIILIGGEGETLDFSLEYGKDKGLRDIQLAYDDSEKLITRLKVLGSTENLPIGYREADLGVATNLKLPESWGKDYIDVDWNYDPLLPETHIWRAVKDEYGIIEGSKEPYDIKPSIEGAVNDSDEPLDEVVIGSSDGIDALAASFSITVNDPGFNPVSLGAAGDAPRISIKSQRDDGNASRLGGYEFTLIIATVTGSKMILSLNRNTEEPTYLPSQALTLDSGDKFVYLGIQMPDEYVSQGEDKVLAKGQVDVQDTNGVAVQYSMDPSSIFLAENPEISDKLIVGNNLPVIDSDLGLEGQPIKIQTVTVSYGDDLPKYSVTIANIKYKALRDSIRVAGQNQTNYNQRIEGNINTNTNITNIIGGETPSWQILD